ncbi:unnamed protein product [Closterium sp. NIES-53]
MEPSGDNKQVRSFNGALPLLAEVSELADEDSEDVRPRSPSPAPLAPPLVADPRGLTSVSASGDEGAKRIAGGRRDVQQVSPRGSASLSTSSLRSAPLPTAWSPTAPWSASLLAAPLSAASLLMLPSQAPQKSAAPPRPAPPLSASTSLLRQLHSCLPPVGYADKLHRRFIDEEQTGRTPKTPVSVDAYDELMFDNDKAQERQEEDYRQKVGSMQFAATTMRPHIAFACSKPGSGLTMRSDQHWREVDCCLAYLANTGDTALEFGGGPELLKLINYVDADDAGNKQNRTSTGGYVFVHGGAAISWSSQRIKCAMPSSTESEYVAATQAGEEGRCLRFLLAEFRHVDAGMPTFLRVDNKSAITVVEGMGLTGNLKHMGR